VSLGLKALRLASTYARIAILFPVVLLDFVGRASKGLTGLTWGRFAWDARSGVSAASSAVGRVWSSRTRGCWVAGW